MDSSAARIAAGEAPGMNTARAERRRSERDRGERDWEARDRDLQRLGRTDLLNLHRDFEYWNPPDPATTPPPSVDVDVDEESSRAAQPAGDPAQSSRTEGGR